MIATRAMNELLTKTDDCTSATYTPRLCRTTQPGSGGAPICPRRPVSQRPQRPQSAPSCARSVQRAGPRRPQSAAGGRAEAEPKTERWREVGQFRWPPVSSGDAQPEQQEVVPFRRTVPNSQKFWGGSLWVGSLRGRGVPLEDPVYSQHGGNINELCQEWRRSTPDDDYGYSKHQAWGGAPSIPYSGSTITGKVALPNGKDASRWVERPVAAGKYALDHMDGKRYGWDQKPRECLTELPNEKADPTIETVRAEAYAREVYAGREAGYDR